MDWISLCNRFLFSITTLYILCKNKKAFNGVVSEINAENGIKGQFNGVSRKKFNRIALSFTNL